MLADTATQGGNYGDITRKLAEGEVDWARS
jgi:hypothetical protein